MVKVVATVEKNRREEIRVALTEYEGRDLCDVRVFAETVARANGLIKDQGEAA